MDSDSLRQGATLGAGVDTSTDPNAPAYFDPEWLEDVVWVAQRVNRHSITNRWLVVDSTRCFELLMKERSAVTTQQCRILVRGAPHLPLQLSCGTSVQFLYPTWQYLKVLEAAGAVPNVPTARYREVEDWMLNHIREFQESRLADASSSRQPGGDAPEKSPPITPSTHPTESERSPPKIEGSDGTAVTPPSAPASTPGMRSKLRDFFQRRSKTTQSEQSQRSAQDQSTSATETPSHQPAPVHAVDSSAASTPATTPASRPAEVAPGKLSKKQAVADFIRRKLHRQEAAQAAALDDSVTESDEDEASLPPLAPAAGAVQPVPSSSEETLEAYSLSLSKVRRMWQEFREDTSHTTFDRLYRRRRATTKWQYEHRDAIFERIKANRTVTIMLIVGVYTWMMHVVPFDVFCLLLLALELWTFYVCTNYRSMAVDFGRRAARTRVDRFKDWFVFGVTRRKSRAAPTRVVILDEDL